MKLYFAYGANLNLQGYRDWRLPLDNLQRASEQVELECN